MYFDMDLSRLDPPWQPRIGRRRIEERPDATYVVLGTRGKAPDRLDALSAGGATIADQTRPSGLIAGPYPARRDGETLTAHAHQACASTG